MGELGELGDQRQTSHSINEILGELFLDNNSEHNSPHQTLDFSDFSDKITEGASPRLVWDFYLALSGYFYRFLDLLAFRHPDGY